MLGQSAASQHLLSKYCGSVGARFRSCPPPRNLGTLALGTSLSIVPELQNVCMPHVTGRWSSAPVSPAVLGSGDRNCCPVLAGRDTDRHLDDTENVNTAFEVQKLFPISFPRGLWHTSDGRKCDQCGQHLPPSNPES